MDDCGLHECFVEDSWNGMICNVSGCQKHLNQDPANVPATLYVPCQSPLTILGDPGGAMGMQGVWPRHSSFCAGNMAVAAAGRVNLCEEAVVVKLRLLVSP